MEQLEYEMERYCKLPYKEYNGSVVYSLYAGEYFRDSGEIEDYLYDNEDVSPRDLMLLHCRENKLRQIPEDYWMDIYPDDSEYDIPVELKEALSSINELISRLPAPSYSFINVRTEYMTSVSNNE